VSRSYAVRQGVIAALAANAIRPVGGRWGSIPGFAAGWLTSELAPQLLAVSAADTAAELLYRRPRGRGSRVGLALGVAAAGTLASVVYAARKTPGQVEAALAEGVGADYADLLDPNLPSDLTVPLGSLARPFRLHSPDVEVLRDVSYTEGGRKAKLDIYRPRGVDLTDAPVLIQVHGGGWTIGTKEQQGLILMNRMAERGWVCVAVNYRLAPKYPFPTQIVDVKRAVAWVREHIAEYGGDPAYLTITGGSAGGHLAALVALATDVPEYQPGFEDADTSVAACVPMYGVYDLAGLTGEPTAIAMRDEFLGPRVFKKNPAKHLDEFVAASPLAHVGKHAPDSFVVHGANDSLVSVRQARAFVAALREQTDATVTYAELPGTQHAFEVFSSYRSQHVIRAVQRWLEWHRARWLAEHRPAPAPAPDSAAG
jgi:acetyl esterase/lipase